jgi:hypothetical protein
MGPRGPHRWAHGHKAVGPQGMRGPQEGVAAGGWVGGPLEGQMPMHLLWGPPSSSGAQGGSGAAASPLVSCLQRRPPQRHSPSALSPLDLDLPCSLAPPEPPAILPRHQQYPQPPLPGPIGAAPHPRTMSQGWDAPCPSGWGRSRGGDEGEVPRWSRSPGWGWLGRQPVVQEGSRRQRWEVRRGDEREGGHGKRPRRRGAAGPRRMGRQRRQFPPPQGHEEG